MVSSDCFRLVVVILCGSSLTNGKKSFIGQLFTRSRVLCIEQSFNIALFDCLIRFNEWLNAYCYTDSGHNRLSVIRLEGEVQRLASFYSSVIMI